MSNTHLPSPPLSPDEDPTRTINNYPIRTLGSPYLFNRQQIGNMYMQIAEPQALQYSRVELDANGQPTYVGDYALPAPYGNGDENVYPQVAQLHTPPLRNRSDSPPTANRVTKPRVKKAPRIRKHNTKRGSTDGFLINGPLSVLTKGMRIPVRDMEAHVMRSTEVRLKEVEQKKGKIARPMNSFMLYRSAYAERTKEWCAQNNHQVVSKAAGDSWPLEPKEVRDHYERLANIERDNHDKAHPNYKFAPNKSSNTPKKKRGSPPKEDRIVDNNDRDFSMPPHARPMRQMSGGPYQHTDFQSRTSTPLQQNSPYDSRQCTPFEQNGDMYDNGDVNKSSWEMSNPGRPLPGMINPPEQTHFYQPSIQQSMLGPNIEDVSFRRMGVPGMPYDAPGALAGLPGNAHPDLFQQQPLPQAGTPESINDLQVDPQLLEFDNQPTLPSNDGGNYENQLDMWQMSNGQQQYIPTTSAPAQDERYHTTQPDFHPGMQQSVNGRDMWSEAQAEVGGEFEDWVSTDTPFGYSNGQARHI
ncbi:hypothetical protein AJ79_04505 [Helicocarpus griseus UAMH5409]|uniref:HMG box domain-containing protein n=1 Tax=Helicocarpus griseus UAMH5409 TaxID=1447875 RepID=A0A2B7XSB2_9EURO|nr:hypothetical protein AJ79_04505 [Helicocarpus griseus UAMH5409]